MEEIILIIDDEMHPEGSTYKRYKHLSEKDLAFQFKLFLESEDFKVEFVKTGEEGLEKIKNDADRSIKLVLLDIRFTAVLTKMQGPEIFRRIREFRGDLPIVVITILPTRKLPREEDIFREFVELGASLFIEKKYFTKRGKEQMNFINAILRKKDVKYILKYREGEDVDKMEILDIDIIRREKDREYSILKNPHRINWKLSGFVEECINVFPNPCHWKNTEIKRMVEDTQSTFSLTDFYKEVFKFNDKIMRSSCGRIPNLLEGLGTVGHKLNVDVVKMI